MEREEMGEKVDKNIRGNERSMVPAECLLDSSRKPAHELLGKPHVQAPPVT